MKKILFSQPEIIEDLVRYSMSEELTDRLDFSTFKAEPTRWVSSRMKHMLGGKLKESP